MNLRSIFLLVVFTLTFSQFAFAQEEESDLPVMSAADVINAIEARCPCADIDEGEAEEAIEDDDADDSVEDKSNNFCRAKLANPGKFKQGVRFFLNLGVVQLEEGETLKSIFSAFKEARRDCKKGKNK